MSGCGCNIQICESQEKKTLYLVLGINTFMFFFEIALGFLAQSTGLIADSLDMLAELFFWMAGVAAGIAPPRPVDRIPVGGNGLSGRAADHPGNEGLARGAMMRKSGYYCTSWRQR